MPREQNGEIMREVALVIHNGYSIQHGITLLFNITNSEQVEVQNIMIMADIIPTSLDIVLYAIDY